MSQPSVAGFFPWRRVKVTYVKTVEASRAAIAVVEPDRRFRPLCHACGAPGAIHARTRKFIRDLSFGDFTMLLQVENRKIRCHHCRKVRVEGLEFVEAGGDLRELLTGSKYLFLKNRGNLKREGRVQLNWRRTKKKNKTVMVAVRRATNACSFV